MRPDETQGLLPSVKIFSPLRSVDNRISVVALFWYKGADGDRRCDNETWENVMYYPHTLKFWEAQRRALQRTETLLWTCSWDKWAQHLSKCAVARRNTKHSFSSNFDLFWAFTKPSNQTRRVIVYAALRVTRMLESVATVSGWRVTPWTSVWATAPRCRSSFIMSQMGEYALRWCCIAHSPDPFSLLLK